MNASTSSAHSLRPVLLEKRARLTAAARTVSHESIHDLLGQIDAALQRIEQGSFGLCETCHDPIEPERLEADPTTCFCLDHLSARERRAHEEDVQLAASIQWKLLPPRDLALAAWDVHYIYEPLGAVGGDYCEVMPLAGGASLFFAVGDVAGKGVAASLLMTHLTAILRSLLSLDLPLADIVARANRLFCEGTTASHYATLACGIARPDRIELCNAGHCPPLLVNSHGVRRCEANGLPLGLFCGVEYPVTTLDLSPGDGLALYSDGVTEAQAPDGSEFGEDRLAGSLRAYAGRGAALLAEAVVSDLDGFRSGSPLTDDMTLLVVRRRD